MFEYRVARAYRGGGEFMDEASAEAWGQFMTSLSAHGWEILQMSEALCLYGSTNYQIVFTCLCRKEKHANG